MDDFETYHNPQPPQADTADDKRLREELRRRICSIIQPYKSSIDEPPIHMNHLVVMSLVCVDRPILKSQIAWWLATNLRYYANLSIMAMCELVDMWPRHKITSSDRPVGQFFAALDAAFDTYEIPARKVTVHVSKDDADEYDKPRPRLVADTEVYWTVSLRQARVYLLEILYPDPALRPVSYRPVPDGRCPLLELPAELREDIYLRVLQYPVSGIWFGSHPRDDILRLHVTKRSLTAPFDPERWPALGTDGLERRTFLGNRISDVLALLRVNKQCRSEALPIFYQINVFCLLPGQRGWLYLLNIPSAHIEHLTHVAAGIKIRERMNQNTISIMAKSVEWLLNRHTPHLSKLTLWFSMYKGFNPSFETPTVGYLVPMRQLARLSGIKQLVVYGDVDGALEAWLRPQIMAAD